MHVDRVWLATGSALSAQTHPLLSKLLHVGYMCYYLLLYVQDGTLMHADRVWLATGSAPFSTTPHP